MTRPTAWLATLVVVTFATAAHAGPNEIRTVTTEQDGAATRVIVKSTQTPTFTVYKLERPTRVVIDVPNARLAPALLGHDSTAAFMPNTWAVSAVTAQQQEDGGAQVRVVITLARPGRYDVQTDGNAFVVRVTARDAAPADAAGSDEARRAVAAAEQARAEAERSKSELAKIRDEVEATRLAATKDREAAARAKADVEAARMAIAAERSEVARAKADAETARLAAAKDREAAATSASERKAARKELDAIARAKADADSARAAAAKDLEVATRAKADADAARAELARVKNAADAARLAATKEREAALRAKAEADAARIAAAKASASTTIAARSTTAPTRSTPPLATTVVDPDDAGAAPRGVARVRDVAYRGREGQGDVDIALTGDVRVTPGVSTRTYAELIVDGVLLPGSLEKKSDVTRFGSPVRTVTVVRDPRIANRFYVRVALLAPATPSVKRSATGVRWHFQGDDMP